MGYIRICNREVAGSNLSRGYFTPRSSQPSIPPGSVNDYRLWLGRQRQEWLIPLADKMQGAQYAGKTVLSLDNASYTRFFLNIARWEFDYFGSNKYLYYILSIK